MEVYHITKTFKDRKVIDDFSYVFKKGDRVGIAGKNGSGKSTLLNMFTGLLQPDSGHLEKGETTVIGYFNQAGMTFKDDERVIDVVKNVAEFITMADGKTISAAQLLTLFLFPPARQYGYISLLSGGEKKRLHLLNILMKNPNFLILDEPTNDLDIDTLNVLEEFLTSYTGILLMVSHDRYLLDKLTDQLFVVEGTGHVDLYNGNYSSYRLEQEEAKQALKNKPVPVAPTPVVAAPKKSKLSFKEQKELETLEADIEKIEKEISAVTDQLGAVTDHQQLLKLSKEIEDMKKAVDEKSTRWMELIELREGI